MVVKKNLIQLKGLVGSDPKRPFDPGCFPRSRNIKPKETNEGVRIIPYARKNGKIYILFGKEKVHNYGNASGKWNLLGGSVPTGKNYLGAAVEELKQESVGCYNTTSEELLKTNYDVYIGKQQNLTCTFFLEVAFIEAKVIESKLSDPNLSSSYKEMTNYMWVDLKSLKENFKNNIKFSKISHGYEIEVTSENGNKEKINLYNYSWDILIQAHKRGYFDNLFDIS